MRRERETEEGRVEREPTHDPLKHVVDLPSHSTIVTVTSFSHSIRILYWDDTTPSHMGDMGYVGVQ